MKRREVFSRLAAVLFYASIPLILPVAYAYYLGEPIAQTFLITVCAMLLISSPLIIPSSIHFFVDRIKIFINFLFKKEVPWNFAAKPMWEESPDMDFSSMKLGDTFALSALVWLVIPLITAYPYYAIGFSPVDSYLESISGWSTTGLSIIPNVDVLPKSFILFRSMTQWVGGLGFIILMLMIFKSKDAKNMLKASGRESIDMGIGRTAKTNWWVYSILTIICIFILYFSGFDLFNSVNIAMTGISTGGWFPFTSYNLTLIQKVAVSLATIIGALNIVIFIRLYRLDLKVLLNSEFLLFLLILISSIAAIFYVTHDEITNASFNLISGLTTSGFSVGDLSLMHDFSKYIIILAMVVGGMSGSTAGGIKTWRIEIAIKTVLAEIKSYFLPPSIIHRVKVEHSCVDSFGIIEVLSFIFLYLLVFLFASGMFMAWSWGVIDSFFLTASALGNVGLSTLDLVPVSNVSKILLTFLMYIGRIEIIPLIALLRFLIRRK